MRAFSAAIIALCANPIGVAILAALDSTLFFSLPLGIDAVVVIVSARLRDLAWVVPLLATAGSTAGAAITYWMGREIGDRGLERYMRAQRLERIRRRARRGTVALASLDLLPPPFPFTVVILAAGALELPTSKFFIALAAFRMVRFGGETVLAVIYGRQILAWLESDVFYAIVAACTAIGVVLTIVSTVRVVRIRRAYAVG